MSESFANDLIQRKNNPHYTDWIKARLTYAKHNWCFLRVLQSQADCACYIVNSSKNSLSYACEHFLVWSYKSIDETINHSILAN